MDLQLEPPIFSTEYMISRYGQGKGLIQCHKTGVTFMFGLVQHMFLIKVSEAWIENSQVFSQESNMG